MPYKHIRLYGKRYVIVPSLDNMCAVEDETDTNLIQGVNPNKIDLRFMRAVLTNILEQGDGTHVPAEVLDRLYQDDVGTAQKLFAECYQRMYHFPKIHKKSSSSPMTPKKALTLLRTYARLRRDGS